MKNPRTVIIGGGWSGLAAAVTLTQHGHPVTVLEAAKQLGGRARTVQWNGLDIDNGQHLMIGGYQTMLDMLNLIHADIDSLFDRHPLNIHIHDSEYPTLALGSCCHLPWQLALACHCLKHNGLQILWQITRLQIQIPRCHQQADQSVANWLQHCRQPARLIKQLWEPLCLATLNTPVTLASAHVFANVIKDMFDRRQTAELLIPKKSLGELFPRHAVDYIENAGGNIKCQTRVTHLEIENHTIHSIQTDAGERIPVQQLIVATSPAQTHKLLPDFKFKPDYFPITTLYLQFDQHIPLKQPMIGLTGGMAQWLFDRQHVQAGLLAVVISGPGEHEKLDNQQLTKQICIELSHYFDEIPAQPQSFKVIREKRATFACSVGIQNKRPTNRTAINGVWLAGDYTASPYPATLESAMYSGQQAALSLMASEQSREAQAGLLY